MSTKNPTSSTIRDAVITKLGEISNFLELKGLLTDDAKKTLEEIVTTMDRIVATETVSHEVFVIRWEMEWQEEIRKLFDRLPCPSKSP